MRPPSAPTNAVEIPKRTEARVRISTPPFNAHKLTDSAHSRTRTETLEVVIPSRGKSEQQQASRKAIGPSHSARKASQTRKSAPHDVVASRDPRLRRGEDSTPLVSDLKSTQMSPSHNGLAPVGPRMLGEPSPHPSPSGLHEVVADASQAPYQQEELQPHSSSQREAYVPPASSKQRGDVTWFSGQREAYVPPALRKKMEDETWVSGRNDNHRSPALIQNEGQDSRHPSRVGGHYSQQMPTNNQGPPSRTPSQTHSPHSPTHNKSHSIPTYTPSTQTSAKDDIFSAIDFRIKAFEEEERIEQQRHEEELVQRRNQQRLELENELEEKIKQRKNDAEMARKEAVKRQEEEYERVLGELRRR